MKKLLFILILASCTKIPETIIPPCSTIEMQGITLPELCQWRKEKSRLTVMFNGNFGPKFETKLHKLEKSIDKFNNAIDELCNNGTQL